MKRALETRKGRARKPRKVEAVAPEIGGALAAIRAEAEAVRVELRARAAHDAAVWGARPSLVGCIYTGFGEVLDARVVGDGSHVVALGAAGYVALFTLKALVQAVHVVRDPICACPAPVSDSEAIVVGLASGEVVVLEVEATSQDIRCRVAKSTRVFTDSPVRALAASTATKMVAASGTGSADVVILHFGNLEVACRFRGPAAAKDREAKARDVSGEDSSEPDTAVPAPAVPRGLQRARPSPVNTANLTSLGAAAIGAQFARTVLQRGRATIAASTFEVSSLAFDLSGRCLYATLAGPEALVFPVENALRVARSTGRPWDSQPHVVFASFEASRFRLTSALVIRDYVFAGASDGAVRVFKAGVPGAADHHNQSHAGAGRASPHHLPPLPQAEPRPPPGAPPLDSPSSPPPASPAAAAAVTSIAAGSMRLAIRPGKAEIASPVVQIAHLEVGSPGVNQVLILVLSQDRTQTLFVVDLVLGTHRFILAVDACLVSPPLGLHLRKSTCLLLGIDEVSIFDLKAAVALQHKELTAELGQQLERSLSRAAERERGRTVDRTLDKSTERLQRRLEEKKG